MGKTRRWRLQHWLLIIVGLLILLPILALIVLGTGQMWGREFCPEDFTTRRFTYNHLPWLNLTVSGIEYTDETSSLQRSLVADGWITPRTGAKAWHLIEDLSNPKHSPDHDAHFLVDFLELPDPWLKFNAEQADKAKVFWPIVAQLAQDELYLYIPAIMQFGLAARVDQSLSDFTQRLHELAQSAYVSRSEIRMDLGRMDDAKADAKAARTFGDSRRLSQLLRRLEEN